MSKLTLVATAVAATLALAACQEPEADPASTATSTSAVVYGNDDRTDWYDVADPDMQALVTDSIVALVRPWEINVSNPNNIVPDASLLEAFPTPTDTPFVVEHVADDDGGLRLQWKEIVEQRDRRRLVRDAQPGVGEGAALGGAHSGAGCPRVVRRRDVPPRYRDVKLLSKDVVERCRHEVIAERSRAHVRSGIALAGFQVRTG